MEKERTTLIVSVNVEDDEDTQLAHVHAQLGAGWRVVNTLPLSGGGMGPGGGSEDFLRLQVIAERTINDDNVIVTDEPDEED